MWDEAKEFGSDVARRLIGRGGEVDFKKESEELAASSGVSIEEARSTLFMDRLSDVQDELRLRGSFDLDGEVLGRFSSGMQETLGRTSIDRIRQDAERAPPYRPLVARSIDPKVTRATEGRFRSQFDGQVPSFLVVRDYATSLDAVQQLFKRIDRDVAGSGTRDVAQLTSTSPEVGADFGKALQELDHLRAHERRFGAAHRFDIEVAELKETTRRELAAMLWRAPMQWIGKMLKSKGVVPKVESSFQFVLSELGSSAKVVLQSLKTLRALVNQVRS
jgi:hypothetical protein